MSENRVVHLTTVHHPLDPRIYRKQARSLAEAGFEVTLMARGEGLTELEGVKFIPLPDGSGKGSRWRRQRIASREIRRIRPDLIHVHDPELLPLARLLQKRTGSRVIYDKHESYVARPGWQGSALRRLEKWAFRWVDHVILAEEAYQAEMPEGVSSTVVLNYALPAGWEKRGHDVPQNEPLRLVYTGTISRGRGLFHMLDLVRLAAEDGLDVHLEIAGICNYPDQRQSAEEIMLTARLGRRVTTAGWDHYAEPEEIEAALRTADVGLMLAEPEPNYLVSVPTKFYEYLQHGLPMIVSDIPLWREFIEHTGAGMLVEPDNVRAVLSAVRSLTDEERRRTMRDAAFRMSAQYEWSEMVPGLILAYERTGIKAP